MLIADKTAAALSQCGVELTETERRPVDLAFSELGDADQFYLDLDEWKRVSVSVIFHPLAGANSLSSWRF